MAGPWARLIGFGSRGYWICEKPKDIFPTPNPGSSEGEVRGAGWGRELKERWFSRGTLLTAQTPTGLGRDGCSGGLRPGWRGSRGTGSLLLGAGGQRWLAPGGTLAAAAWFH